jgi:hypothetical protein
MPKLISGLEEDLIVILKQHGEVQTKKLLGLDGLVNKLRKGRGKKEPSLLRLNKPYVVSVSNAQIIAVLQRLIKEGKVEKIISPNSQVVKYRLSANINQLLMFDVLHYLLNPPYSYHSVYVEVSKYWNEIYDVKHEVILKNESLQPLFKLLRDAGNDEVHDLGFFLEMVLDLVSAYLKFANHS